jgi:hypothetical protein
MALPSRRLQWLAQAVLIAGCVGLDPGWLLGGFTLALVLMAGLKLLEARDRTGRRLVALLQLVGCGLLAAQQPDLLPSLVQLLAAVFCSCWCLASAPWAPGSTAPAPVPAPA